MTNICVFAGSSHGLRPSYRDAARRLGNHLAGRGIGLVYGGASVGLMGTIAESVLQHGGDVTGVLPRALLDVEIAHQHLTELRIAESMHDRKAQMAELSDAFILLPGGIGSLEETFEAWTWSQLGLHGKPIGILNVDGFYDGLLGFLDHLVSERFMKQAHRDVLVVEQAPEPLIDRLRNAEVPRTSKWVDP